MLLVLLSELLWLLVFSPAEREREGGRERACKRCPKEGEYHVNTAHRVEGGREREGGREGEHEREPIKEGG